MNKNLPEEKKLADLLKAYGTETPAGHFSEQLTRRVVAEYAGARIKTFRAERWLGKLIIAVLVSFNLLFLCYLGICLLQPVLFFSFAAFIMGVGVVVVLAKRAQQTALPGAGN